MAKRYYHYAAWRYKFSIATLILCVMCYFNPDNAFYGITGLICYLHALDEKLWSWGARGG